MTTPTYVSPFTGTVVTPTDVSFSTLTFATTTQLYWPSVANSSEAPATRIINANATATGQSIILPDARQGTVGADVLIKNTGTNPFYVVNANLGQSVQIAGGVSLYFYLTDNTTLGGIWNNVTFGAGTSAADAATLQGAGLTTLAGQLATTQNIVDVSIAPTINDASRAATFVWSGGVGTFTLPVPSSITTGWYIGFRNSGTGALTIAAPSPATINGAASIFTNPGDSGFVYYDYSTLSYVTVGLAAQSSITFTSGTYDVDSISGATFSLQSFAPIIQTYVALSNTRVSNLTITLPAITQFYILSNATGKSGYNLIFQLAGSSGATITLTTGSIVTVLSDGVNLYILNASSSSIYKASNGTAGLPAYSFTNDVHTGMYLDGNNILGLSANSQEVVRVDNTNTSQTLVTVNGQLNPQSIGNSNGTAGLPAYSFTNDTHTGMYLDGSNILGLSANSQEVVRIDNTNTSQTLVTVNGQLNAQLITGGTF